MSKIVEVHRSTEKRFRTLREGGIIVQNGTFEILFKAVWTLLDEFERATKLGCLLNSVSVVGEIRIAHPNVFSDLASPSVEFGEQTKEHNTDSHWEMGIILKEYGYSASKTMQV